MSQVNIFEAQQMACLMGEYSECGRPATEKDATIWTKAWVLAAPVVSTKAFGKTIHVFNEVDLTAFVWDPFRIQRSAGQLRSTFKRRSPPSPSH